MCSRALEANCDPYRGHILHFGVSITLCVWVCVCQSLVQRKLLCQTENAVPEVSVTPLTHASQGRAAISLILTHDIEETLCCCHSES